MNEALIHLDTDSSENLQAQIRRKLVDAIIQGVFPPSTKLPSSRKLSQQLGVARNTVVLAYEQLIDEQFLESRERSGIYVSPEVVQGRVGYDGKPSADVELPDEWKARINVSPTRDTAFKWPANWQQNPYPFIDGFFDSSLYPSAQWREASRLALGSRIVSEGSATDGDADDPALIEEIRTKMLPRRGITAQPDEILITLGQQNALYILTRLLVKQDTRVAMEEPGNPNMRQLLLRAGARVEGQPIDECGLIIHSDLDDADLVYVTPSHQFPTAVTMPNRRRRALLSKASSNDQLIIEDDVEHESNYLGKPHPALRGLDRENRVIYVSGLPKVLSPGLRIGFIVAAPELIREARRLRQLVIGRPSIIHQSTAAQFLSLGHYDAFMARLHRIMGERWDALRQALNHYHRGSEISLPTSGGTALWMKCPDHILVSELVKQAAKRGILIEPDNHYYQDQTRSRNFFRLGVTSIPLDQIREGIHQLERLIRKLSGDHLEQLDPEATSPLDEGDLQALLENCVIHYRTFYSDPCTIELHQGGGMIGRAGHANEDRDEGKWWIENNLYCRQWKKWGYGEVSKLLVTVEGNLIRWWRPSTGHLVDSAIIEPAQKLA